MLTDSEWELLAKRMRLTPRETQVLRGVFAEQTDDAIAIDLGITTRTVRAHLGKIYQKCECRTRTGAVVSAFKIIHHSPPKAENTEKIFV